MINCKKILHLSLFFAFSVPLCLGAQTFNVVDLQRLVQNHPLMKQFDPATGRFKGTPSEIRNIENLKTDSASISRQIDDLKAARQEKLHLSMTSPQESRNEEGLWSFLNDCDRLIEQKKLELKAIEDLIVTDGIPGFETVLQIATGIASDALSQDNAPDTVVLNRLPRTRAKVPPEFPRKGLRDFYWHNDSGILEIYLKQASLAGLMFRSIDNPVVYNLKTERSSEK